MQPIDVNQEKPVPVALLKADNYAADAVTPLVFKLLEAADISHVKGEKILVKPNLLQAKELACANAAVTAAVCAWLLDNGAKVTVSDSPAFGTVTSVSRAIGLARALEPLGLAPQPMGQGVWLNLPLPQDMPGAKLKVARRALEADRIISVAKVKAHSQMRITLSVKNCFGCVPGLFKAMAHTLMGSSTSYFADCVAALWSCLPPVAGVLDGITAMHVTGPAKGAPYPLHLLGASRSAPALDAAMMRILNIDCARSPIQAALEKRLAHGDMTACTKASWPLLEPGDFSASGFIVPETLSSASFNPFRLIKSCIKRFWLARRH